MRVIAMNRSNKLNKTQRHMLCVTHGSTREAAGQLKMGATHSFLVNDGIHFPSCCFFLSLCLVSVSCVSICYAATVLVGRSTSNMIIIIVVTHTHAANHNHNNKQCCWYICCSFYKVPNKQTVCRKPGSSDGNRTRWMDPCCRVHTCGFHCMVIGCTRPSLPLSLSLVPRIFVVVPAAAAQAH